jgi:beta-N-acetylhexosaminidase
MNKAEIGRHLIVGFDGTDINDEIRFALRDLCAGGVILFTRNYEEPTQVRDLVVRLRELSAHDRLLVCVDQEGGKVQRFRKGFTPWPDAASFAEYGDIEFARKFGRFNAAELAAVGIDLNFAPVCDVNTRAENPVIGRRSFSSDPKIVSDYARAVIDGTQSAGVLACAKHFPGHGDTTLDSHKDLPVVEQEPGRLEETELAPFRVAASSGVATIMTAHVLYPAWDEELPATLSEKIIAKARGIPYEGVIVTDDLEMAAIADRYGMEESAVLAMKAGCDVLLCCRSVTRQEQILKVLYDALLAENIKRSVLRDSDMRLLEMWNAHPLRTAPPLSVIGREEHLDLAERVRRASDGKQ